jgi:hypothetical protein
MLRRLTNAKVAAAVGLLGLNVAAITLPMVASADTVTSTTTINLTVNGVITSYSSGPTVTLGAITPDSTGRQSTASDTVSAATNNSTGLNITLEANGASTNMVSGGNTIATGAGSPASPAALTNNHWGWRIDSLAGFGAGPGAVLNSAAPSGLTYAGMPASGSPYTINTTGSTGSTSSTVWYSARVDNTQATGSYSTVVKYTISTN